MTSILERCRADLDRLVREGEALQCAMKFACQTESYTDEVLKKLGEKAAKFLSSLPDFFESYESWYSESLAVIRQLLPDRVSDFTSLYEKTKNRKSLTAENYVIQDFLQGLQRRSYMGDVEVDGTAALSRLMQQRSILLAATRRYESALFDIRKLAHADVFDSELDAAKELQKNKFLRSAGVLAGVVLERHLAQVCAERSLVHARKTPGIMDLAHMLQQAAIIDVPQHRLISLLASIRNLCGHEKNQEPTFDQISDLIAGTDKIIRMV